MLLGAESATLTRFAASVLGDDGRQVRGSGVSTPIMMTGPQPVRGDELNQFPELDSSTELVKGYTETAVKTLSEAARTAPDRITKDGVTYEVHRSKRQPAIIPHYKIWLVRLDA